MHGANIPLLITTAINPPAGIPFLKMTNSFKRKILSKAAVYHWIGKGITQIVIADATNCELLTKDELDELTQMGITIEQISYQQDSQRAQNKGKGFAEGKLLEHALENSTLLEKSTHFYKSTGKTFVRNFSQIESIVLTQSLDAIFWKHHDAGDLSKPWADTRFYYSSIDFAIAHLIPSHLESDDKFSACEFHIFHELNKTCQTATTLRPQVHGFAGGTDTEYFDECLGYLDSHYPCWIHK